MIRWTEPAADQLESLYEYITWDKGEQVAARIAELIGESIQGLERYPMLGRPGRVSGTRELVVAKTPFLIAYTIDKDCIVILAIYHGAQSWPHHF
jgi:toxin ParE1/3/4